MSPNEYDLLHGDQRVVKFVNEGHAGGDVYSGDFFICDYVEVLYHALHRDDDRDKIFKKPADDEAFERILHEGLQKYPVELFSFTLMPNHWHLVLRPAKAGRMGRFLRWFSASHTLFFAGSPICVLTH